MYGGLGYPVNSSTATCVIGVVYSGVHNWMHALQVILGCVYGASTTVRLKQQGMEFAVWVFKHAEDAQLRPHAAVILQKLLQLLNQGKPLNTLCYLHAALCT